MSILENWFSDLTAWLKDWGLWLWDGFLKVMHDVMIFWMEAVLGLVSLIINELPAPDFLYAYSLAGLLGNAGPTVGWIMGTFNIDICMSVIASGYAFRILRKFGTLFQW